MRRAASVACVVVFAFSAASRGEYIATFSQVGANVVVTGSGTINTTDLTLLGVGPYSRGVFASSAELVISSSASGSGDIYSSISGPSSFGPGNVVFADSGTGDFTGLFDPLNEIGVPTGYSSGSSLSGSLTFDNTTIAGLGLTPGTYTWTWGTGLNADSFEIIIPAAAPAPIPEPSTLMMAGLALSVVGCGAWMRRRRVVASAA